MSLQGALNASISALSAQSTALSVISDNLANSQTTAYKSSSTSFSSLVAGSGTNSSGGVAATMVSNVDQQGLLVQSTDATHLAIEGDGFFIVSDGTDATSTYYTRDGEFTVDSDGYLTNGGYYLLGWTTDADGEVTGGTSENSLEAIDLDSVQSSVDATSSVEFQANLPADAEVGDSFETSFEVYDSLGTTSTVTATYSKTAENTWEIAYSDPTLSSTGETIGTVTSAAIEVTFNADGTLASTNPDPAELTIEGWTTGAADSSITLGLGDADSTTGLTQYASDDGDPSIDVQSIDQDGLAYGNLSSIEISDDGSVIAFFDNGEERSIYQIPIATFGNPDGLEEDSEGIYSRSSTSGNATLHEAGEGGAGSIQGGWLEASTVDTGEEFSNMMSAQQAYSAASQIMSTASDMFDTLLDAVR
ncbi:flagellar hook protein FlgE [Roseibium polysiphoniae]|uniref:flagellar hook protein FlgE n=1 Tax=Roseibium polysiphoniae TaxID=2571221 RepID=UPI0025938A9A|nr:flagellar hook protein FlgE [uncultured Roseibium sp.]